MVDIETVARDIGRALDESDEKTGKNAG